MRQDDIKDTQDTRPPAEDPVSGLEERTRPAERIERPAEHAPDEHMLAEHMLGEHTPDEHTSGEHTPGRHMSREHAPGEREHGSADGGVALEMFPSNTAERFRDEWQRIQTRFVDDPRDAVRSADHLVDEVIRSLGEQKHELENLWQQESETEDLRQALRRYRSFFDQLLNV